jgi:hypothetical protein
MAKLLADDRGKLLSNTAISNNNSFGSDYSQNHLQFEQVG